MDQIVPTTSARREAIVAGNADVEVKRMAREPGRAFEAGITEAEQDGSEMATMLQVPAAPSAMTSEMDADEKLYAFAVRVPEKVIEPVILDPTIEVIRAHVEAASNRPAYGTAFLLAERKNEMAIKESTMAPEARLDGILKFYDQNRRAEASLAITEFRRLYPDHPVSAELVRRGL
jgi:hypothetical protein